VNTRWHVWWRLSALATDTVALAIALGGAAILRFGPETALELAQPEVASVGAPWALGVAIWVGALAAFGAHNPVRCANGVEEARRLASGCFAAPTAFILLSFVTHTQPSRLWVATGTVASFVTVGAGRRGLRAVVTKLRRRGKWMTRSVIVGGRDAKLLADAVDGETAWGTLPVATCGFTWDGLPRWELHELRTAVESTGATSVLIAASGLLKDEVQDAVAIADELPVHVFVAPGLDYVLLHNLNVVALGHQPALSLERPSLRAHQRFVKRTVDIVGSVSGLVVLSPLLALIAAAIRLDSKGAPLYVQRRVGVRGKEFDVVKFRTMVEGADEVRDAYEVLNEVDGTLFKIRDDPRLTRVGRFLRRCSLDELPQLWNVLRGDMSLVGPRPALPEEVQEYDRSLVRRLGVRPGITGLWQVSGRSDLAFEDYVRLDLTYVQNWGLLLDLYIFLRTIPVVIRGRGAY
jgi:exopolysaccharide biosynthesis polyprenyl glycosylphosphotransferase